MVAFAALAHIPGPKAAPLIGHTLNILHDSYGFHGQVSQKYGNVYKVNMLGEWRVILIGADALEMVLTDKDQIFSSEQGWDMIKDLFPGGLMLRDFDNHRRHRRIMQAAFKAPTLRAYQIRMGQEIQTLVGRWALDTPFEFYPAVKDLTLRMGGAVFMGLPTDAPETRHLNKAFADEVAGSFGLVRKPLPFTKLGRGVAGRKLLVETFSKLIGERRTSGGDDFFSQMCLAKDEDGAGWSDAEIVDHFNFLLMAAHDTTASALTTMVWALSTHPEWQDRLIEEVAGLPPGPLTPEAMAQMELTERVFKEALRLVPPVPFIPRRATRAFEFEGVTIPAGTSVSVSPGMVMSSPQMFTNPESFDPDRFSPNRAEDKRHRYAWAPFGGGAHKCIGLHFSTMQVKTFVAALLRHARVEGTGAPEANWQRMPIPQPKDKLPVILRPL
jgi:cytochrome P450